MANSRADIATVCQPPGSLGGICLPPSQGASRNLTACMSKLNSNRHVEWRHFYDPIVPDRPVFSLPGDRASPFRQNGSSFHDQEPRLDQPQVAKVDDVPIDSHCLPPPSTATSGDHDPIAPIRESQRDTDSVTRSCYTRLEHHRVGLLDLPDRATAGIRGELNVDSVGRVPASRTSPTFRQNPSGG